jgi:hypothetical protein
MAAHVTWSAAAGAVSYDLVAGTMLGGPVYCLANNTPQHEANDPGIAVAPGHALYYLERSFSGTEDDIWGRTSTGAPRADTGACSSGCTPSVCDDHNVCTVDGCDGGSHDCTHTLISCDDGNGCTTDTCDPQGGCAHLPRTGFCDDGTACTQGDACQNGTCLGSPLDCNDGNPCTADACDPGTGCVYSLLNQACDDGRACTANDHCAAGQCTGNVVTCDDGSPCTNDYCNDDTGCGHTPRTGSCEDGDFCTTQDSCQSGACVGGPPASCDDGNSCTEDVCSPSVGCAHAPRTGSCDDGNACTTGDTCAGGLCAGGPPASCDDGNSCTSDFCSAPQGCVHEPVFGPCNDGNPCTTGEACAEGTCGGGVVTTCDDGNACTDDSCLEGGGCLFTIDDTNACSDGNPCTADRCSAGICVSDPGAPVTQTFASPAPILIPATGTSGQAGPYPSILTLPPLGPLVSLQVQLNGLNHAFPDDIDMLLVGPTGQDAKILSDVGGNIPAHVNLILDDLAPASLPDAGPLVSGTFKPTNIGPADSFPGAPLPTGNTNLSIFNGSPPGGTWSLYIFDDSGIGGAGSLQNGWALVVTSQCLGAAPLLEASTSGGTRYVPVAASARRSGTSTKSADRSDTGPPGPSEPTQMTGEGR